MSAATQEREQTPFERAEALRARIGRDSARVAEIGELIASRDEEIRAARGDAIRESPTADLGARVKSSLKRLLVHRDSLEQERRTLEAELPHRAAILAELESDLRLDRLQELRTRRAEVDARIVAALRVCADSVYGAVMYWTAEFVAALEEAAAFAAEVRGGGFEQIDDRLLVSAVDAVPVDPLRFLEMLLVCGGALDHESGTMPWPSFRAAADIEDMREATREATDRLAALPVSFGLTSWRSSH
jgi:hypothetical protein